jgi:type I protein arginine methyltransferase
MSTGSYTKTPLNDSSPIMQGTEADKAADFANYFCSYAYLYHQKQMLMDHVRMRAYHSAIMSNKSLFEGKVVLDVGTGSGVLSIWAAQAGASKVFAVEYTDMAKHARTLVENNGLSHIIEVIQSSVEDLELGDIKVDIIISEWMGYFLLRESMLDSVIRARDRWLAPTGAMYPSHAAMYWGAIAYEDDREGKKTEYLQSMEDWAAFSKEMKEFYNVNVGSLDAPFEKEQSDYYIYSSLWTELSIEHLIGQPALIKELDINVCSLEDGADIKRTPFEIIIPFPIRISGFAGWFTVDFEGSQGSPATNKVQLSTGPEMGYTHWGQQVFYLKDPIDCSMDTRLHGFVTMFRQDRNKRLYKVRLELAVDDGEMTTTVYEIP